VQGDDTAVERGRALLVVDVVQRSRRLVLTAASLPPGCTGLWAASQSADYIFYRRGTTPAEQLRGISHEIGHTSHAGIYIVLRCNTHRVTDKPHARTDIPKSGR
jgi:hypothetical protein